MFGDILDRIKKNLDYENIDRVKHVFFSKGLVNGFGQKFEMFSTYLFVISYEG